MFKSLIVLLFVSAGLLADTQQEIDHLLNFVGNTTCKYERNGSLHTGSEAREHISKKYVYYKDQIHSTEDFIKYSATKSEMTGEKYKILCPGKSSQYSGQWLLNELKCYRSTQQTH